MNDASLSNENKSPIYNEIKANEYHFLELIRKRLGITIKEHQRQDMYRTIEKACKEFSISPTTYLRELFECLDNSPKLEFLVIGITIGETYFFRDSHQMRLLQENILPTIIKNKRKQNNLSIRIWSAGCASGEEIYTIAMMLDSLLSDIDTWNISLLGTDINTLSLKKGINGLFTEWSMRTISPYYKHRYFVKEDQYYRIKEYIRKLVNFGYLNLNDDMYPSVFNNTNAQDLILCRNVMIYFDSNHIQHLMKNLNASLVEEGFLLLGASDPVNLLGTTLSTYMREGALLQNKLHISAPKISKPVLILKPPVEKKSIQCKQKLPLIVTPSITPSIKLKEANPTSLINNVIELANVGKLDLAYDKCLENLKKFPTNDVLHFTLAMILEEKNNWNEAEKYLRKTIFLNHKFVAAHFKLGLMLLKDNQFREGLKYLDNALSIAIARDPAEMVEGFYEMNYQQLSSILQREIALYLATEI